MPAVLKGDDVKENEVILVSPVIAHIVKRPLDGNDLIRMQNNTQNVTSVLWEVLSLALWKKSQEKVANHNHCLMIIFFFKRLVMSSFGMSLLHRCI